MLLALQRTAGQTARVGVVGLATDPAPVVVGSVGRPNGAATADGGNRTVWSGPYDNVNAGYTYPPPVVVPSIGRSAAGRGGVPAAQTDFALKVLDVVSGPRWNGLLLGLPVATLTYTAPDGATYVQVLRGDIAQAILTFPAQYAGLRVRATGGTIELSLVALADAPNGMGGVWRVQANGVTRAVYLVETTDGNASPVRVRTEAGTKAARVKT